MDLALLVETLRQGGSDAEGPYRWNPRQEGLREALRRPLSFLVDLWAKAFPERRVRVYVHLGPGAEAFREELPRILRSTLKAERGRIAALEVNLKEALGPKTLVGFAYPLPEA